jgi:hypothetical protein
MVAEPSAGLTKLILGALGYVYGVTGFDGPDGELVPTALLAVTVKVYATPTDRPPNTTEL